MRILLLADIHSNWPALQVVNERFDLCVFLGDLVDYGLEPAPCIDWVRKNCKLTVRGNHDHGAAQNVTVNGMGGFKWLTGVTRPLTRQRLTEPDRRFLMEMPVTRWATLNDLRFLFVHATPRDPLDEYAPASPEFWAKQLENLDADIVCVGHTHIPFVLDVGNKLVINPGSIGLPRDGNPRASYAVLEGRRVELKRIDYPIENSVQVVKNSALPDPAKELLIEVYRTGEAKNPKVDSRIVRPRPSNQGTAALRPALAPPAPPPAGTAVVRGRATSQGVVRPGGTSQGTETVPAPEVFNLQPEGVPTPPQPPRRETQRVPVIRPPQPPEPPAEGMK
jgi:putative phosphoesterase